MRCLIVIDTRCKHEDYHYYYYYCGVYAKEVDASTPKMVCAPNYSLSS